MQQPVISDFELLLFRSGNEVGAAVLLVYAWISASDGEVSDSEAERLAKIAGTSNFHGHAGMLTRLARERDLGALQLACEIIRANFTAEKARQFLGLAVGVAFADRSLKESENHIIRFLADLLGIKDRQLDELFLEFTGEAMPRMGAPGSARRQGQRSGASKETTDRLSDTLEAIGLLRGQLGLGHTAQWSGDCAAEYPGDSSAPRSLYAEFREKISGEYLGSE